MLFEPVDARGASGVARGEMEPLRRLLGAGPEAHGAIDDLQSMCSPSVRLTLPHRPPAPTRPSAASAEILKPPPPNLLLLPPQRLMKMVGDWGRAMLPPEEVTVEGRGFQIQQQLGEGGFSYVFLAREVPDSRGVDVALKRMLVHEREQEADALREMETMRRFDHPNLLPLILGEIETEPTAPSTSTSYLTSPSRHTHPSHQPRRCHMVFPAYHEGTALDRCVQRPIAKAFTPTQLLSIGTQLCSALEHMHGMGIAHYDVKPGNVLLESVMDDASHRGGMKAVLMDFGSARVARRAVTSRQGALQLQELAERESTAPFRAPELWDCPSDASVDERVDVWSLGCTLFALCSGGRSPFESAVGETGGSLALAVLSGKYGWGESAVKEYGSGIRAAIGAMLVKDQAGRMNAAEARSSLNEQLGKM